MIRPPRHSPCFSFSRGLAARLRGVRRAMPALREQGTDPQPSRGFLRCGAGRLLPHSCRPFSQTSSKMSLPGGAL